MCYSCSISCHGEHTLVELFGKRNFVCDCGTTRLPDSSPCALRFNEKSKQKGGVTGEEPAQSNKYNQNFSGRFCGCGGYYDPEHEKGTMFQCLGLGNVEDGGCGEDWWHPECIVGLDHEEYKKSFQRLHAKRESAQVDQPANGIVKAVTLNREEESVGPTEARRPSIVTAVAGGVEGTDLGAREDGEDDIDPPNPPSFPDEDDFEGFICYKCVEAFPWIKRYAGAPGFLPPVYAKPTTEDLAVTTKTLQETGTASTDAKKRKDADMEEAESAAPPKRQKCADGDSSLATVPEATALSATSTSNALPACKLDKLAPAPASGTPFSLFFKPGFHDQLCHCPAHFGLLKPHPQLLEEEETYEPPLSEGGDDEIGSGARSVGTGSLLDRGEAALSNVDRVRAIEGVMVYNHLKSKVKAFLQPFAESGQPVGAEDIKAYFEKLRGDEQGIRDAAGGADEANDDGQDGDHRREQSGY